MPKKTANKGSAWLHYEVCALLDIWANREIQQQLSGRLHNMCIYERISSRLRQLGIVRTGEQCREKIKKLRRDYKTVIDNKYSPAFARKVLMCYDTVHAIFGKRPDQTPSNVTATRTNNSFENGRVKGQEGKCNAVFSSSQVHELNVDETNSLSDCSSQTKSSELQETSTNDLKDTKRFPAAFGVKTKHSNFEKKSIKSLIGKHLLLIEKVQIQQAALHDRFLGIEQKRFDNELARERQKLMAIETQRQKDKEQEIKLFKMVLNAIACKHGQT